jgi:polysaccharide deacetylase 2 family uncharacterized protein YibQ
MQKSGRYMSNKVYLAFIGFVVVSVLMIALISYLPELDEKGNLPPFEETHTPSRQLLNCIHLVDRSIFEGFHRMGVPQEGILFLSVVPSQQDDYRWDFSFIEVRIPRDYDLLEAGKEICTRISQLGMPVQTTVDQTSRNEINCNVFCNGLTTHRLKLVFEATQRTHRELSPKIAIIIDDLGYDRSLAKAFISLDFPLTLSVLPFTPHTRSIAQGAKKKGREVMLHLPMEPRTYPQINPGDGVLLMSMEEDMILRVMDRDLTQIPFVAGVNNHMGSRFTEDKEKMLIVLTELKRRGLYFIDSKTSRNSVASNLAQQIQMRAATRDIFLDNDLSESALKIQMDRLLNLARHRGHAIGIGHPHKETLGLLNRYRTILNNETDIVPVSRLVSY